MSQEQKETQYKDYDWSANTKWQSYLSNVYPVPPLARLEKMKRKWYKNNVDKAFDVDFNASSTASSSNTNSQQATNTDQQQRQQHQQPQSHNQFFPGVPAPGPDLKPKMKGPQFAAWLFFFVCYVSGVVSPTIACMGALASGVIRKGGFPQMSMDYAQRIMLDENTQLLGILGIASTVGRFTLVCWMPLLIHGVLTCAATARDQSHVTGIYAKVINMVQRVGLQKVSDNQAYLWMMRHDMEVYMSIYLTVGIIVGISSIMTALLYWQIMCMRYLMSPAIQQAWSRFDAAITEKMASSWCPRLIETGYVKIRGFLKGQIDSTVNQAQQNQDGAAAGGGGISGMLSRATQSCTVF